jgi:hypothetical protein
MAKKALITGITGQDGSYLAEFLLEKGYEVHGIVRRSSSVNIDRIDHLPRMSTRPDARLRLHYGDLTDAAASATSSDSAAPTRSTTSAAQSHVRVSFDQPIFTVDVTGTGHAARAGGCRRIDPRPVRSTRPAPPRCSARSNTRYPEREHPLPPPQPLRLREGLLLLADGELPGILRHARQQRHPVQPRVPAPRRDLRDAQDHPGGHPHQAGPAGALYMGNLDASATGASPGTMWRRCG